MFQLQSKFCPLWVTCPFSLAIYMYKIVLFFKCLLLWNHVSNFHQISHGAFFWKGVGNVFEWFRAMVQDGCHADIWLKALKKLWGWILVYSINSRSAKSVQTMVMDWPLTFLKQICAFKYLYGENVEKSFSYYVLKTNAWNLQCMIKEVKLSGYHQNFGGYLPLPLVYIHI